MQNTKLKLAVLFGGVSPEYEVSCNSAASILRNIDYSKYELYVLGITKQGRWMLTHATPDEIADTSWEMRADNKEASICPDRTVHGIRTKDKDIAIDLVFNIIHGQNGEDGTMQGLLDIAGLKYVGPGTCSSAVCMDKEFTKLIVKQKVPNVKMARHYCTDRYTFSHAPEEEIANIEEFFGKQYPLFVKPACDGSSVGVSKVKDQIDLFEALKLAASEDFKILIEECVVGREMEIAVLGNLEPRATVPGEILSANEFYDYEAKYTNPETKTRVVDDLPEEKVKEIQDIAVAIYKALGCRGLSRVDFFLKENGDISFTEINTLPGFTKISLYPQLWESSGIPYTELIDKLIEYAMEEN